MRNLLFCSLIVLAAPAWAVEWRPLPSPAEYKATVDLDSVKPQKNNLATFTLRRAYSGPQAHPSGKNYYSTRLIYVTDCRDRSSALAVTQYYGEDRKLINADVRPGLKRSEFTTPEPGSEVAEAVRLACERFAELGKGEPGSAKRAEPAQPIPGKPLPRSSSGSGIVVSRDGYILTNQHVVRQCDSYEVIDDANRKLAAALQAIDVEKDLALLTVKERFPAAAAVRKDAAPKLGEAVTVVGYPLVGVLGTRPTVGFGNISSTVGIRGDPMQMQISVPVQRGNSGGPLMDQAGNVIGVVVSKLDAFKFAQRTGDIPQNVNFAIKGEVVRTFLDAQNIDFTSSDNSSRLDNTEIASRGAAVTVRVRCLREPATAQ